MYFGFELYRDDSIEDLEERLKRINSFLAERISVENKHRQFGVFLLPPKKSKATIGVSYLAARQSKTEYRLCIEFFHDNDSNPDSTMELIYNLGKTPELYDSLKSDVSAISYLAAYPEQEEVTFMKSSNSLSIMFNFNDNNPYIKRIKNHLDFLIPNLSNKN